MALHTRFLPRTPYSSDMQTQGPTYLSLLDVESKATDAGWTIPDLLAFRWLYFRRRQQMPISERLAIVLTGFTAGLCYKEPDQPPRNRIVSISNQPPLPHITIHREE